MNRVQINNVDHADLKVAIAYGADYGDSVNQLPVFPTEFEEVAREYPILFQRDDNGVCQSLALLGLDRDENLFLSEKGWLGRYVPAIQQRGPFSIGLVRSEHGDEPADALIHADLDDPRVGSESGHALFLPHGGNAPYLNHIAGVLRVLHQGVELSGPMFAAFEDHGLLRPVTLEVKLAEGRQYDIPDRFTIDEVRLSQLDGAALEKLNSGGFLRAAFAVAWSLANVARLVDLKNQRDRG
ncbi:SapC family protein [Sphingomonas crusticola]|uniref:SapC family protein n=1 Tax=Sphingomonas crusticola TaxID=1697973 RepID=UPI000E2876D7|nr:SapC family protein [Sphingomonas crusticola]